MLLLSFKSLDGGLGCLVFELQGVEDLVHVFYLVVFLLYYLVEA